MLAQDRRQPVGVQGREAGNDPVRRQNEQAGVVHADEHHQNRLGRRVGVAGRLPVFEVAQPRLVAVVAVGDEHGLRPQRPGDGADGVLGGDRPDFADDAEVIGGLDRQRPADGRLELVHDAVVGVGVETEDGTEVHVRGVEQAEAVGLGAGQCFLMGVDAAGAERLQADASQEAAAGVAATLDLKILRVDVERLGGIADEHVVGLPVAEEAGGAGVAVDAVVVAGLFLVEDEADDVVGTAVVERLLQGGVDDVVGRGDHVAEGADAAQVVAVGAECVNLGHEASSFPTREGGFTAHRKAVILERAKGNGERGASAPW